MWKSHTMDGLVAVEDSVEDCSIRGYITFIVLHGVWLWEKYLSVRELDIKDHYAVSMG